ncbi:MAG: hypothetical protein WCC94_03620 [Candidatus Bathyarchaeia archaeon]
MKKLRSLRSRLFGYLLLVTGCWLLFDLSTTISVRPLANDGWRFCLPFFMACVDSGHWTLIADMAIGVILIGGIVLDQGLNLQNVHFQVNAKEVICTVAVALAVGAAVTLLLISVDPLHLLFP